MNFEELKTRAFEYVGKGQPLDAMELFYREYEQGVAEIREVSNAQQNSVGFKAATEHFYEEVDPVAVEDADMAMDKIRRVVFETIEQTPSASVLLYDRLADYAKDDVKVYRDFIVNQIKRGLVPDENATDEEVPETRYSVEELRELRTFAENFWTIAGSPEIPENSDDEDEHAPSTKQLKKGVTLSFSNLPRSSEADEKDNGDSSVKTSRLRYSVDGEEIPAGTSLSAVGMWYLSSPDWTVTVSDIKSAVARSTDKEWSEVDDFNGINVNGHSLARWREDVK